jgi:ribose 5-phosphate isomerase B
VGGAVAGGSADLGVCVCGTGNGIAMTANKVPGVRAAVVHDVSTAVLARRHTHANVFCVGARITGATVAVDALAAFMEASEEHGRHDGRLEKMARLDRALVHQLPVEGMP